MKPDDARKIAAPAREKLIDAQIREILASMKRTAEKGYYEYDAPELLGETVVYLRKLGYKVTRTLISWVKE